MKGKDVLLIAAGAAVGYGLLRMTQRTQPQAVMLPGTAPAEKPGITETILDLFKSAADKKRERELAELDERMKRAAMPASQRYTELTGGCYDVLSNQFVPREKCLATQLEGFGTRRGLRGLR